MPTATPTTATPAITTYAPILHLVVTPSTLALVDTQFIPVIQYKLVIPVGELVLRPFRPQVPGSYLKTGRLSPRAR
jgi:hypothetical protein